MFDASTYADRRARLLRALDDEGIRGGKILFLGNAEAPRNYADNGYPFRQDSSFLYFVGPSRPSLAAAMDLAEGGTVFYGDDHTMDDIIWTGPRPSIAQIAARSGIAATKPRGALAADLAGREILYLPPYRADTRSELAELTGARPAAVGAGASAALIRAAVALREIKSEAEVAEIERAVATTVDMHRAAMAIAREGMLESDIAARVIQIALAAGGGPAFPPIATTRPATLHDHDHSARLAVGGLFLLDCGAETEGGYAGDLTSTFPIGPRFDARQRALYDIVIAMRERASAMIRPGLPYRDAHLAAARVAVLGLETLGLMKGDVDEAVAAGAHALFFPHGLGHMLGLDVHDMESYGEDRVGYGAEPRSRQFGLRHLRLAKRLEPGMVVTVEPGLYFIPELVAQWEAEGRFAHFIDYRALGAWMAVGGVRSEEDWLVLPGGGRRLGPGLDASASAVEAARGAR